MTEDKPSPTNETADRDQHHSLLDKISDGYHDAKRETEEEDEQRARAALKIQKLWRQRNGRAQLQSGLLSSELRWKDAAAHAKLKVHRKGADTGRNNVKERWMRAAFFASKLRDGNEVLNRPDAEDDPDSLPIQKHLETQHWLELIDSKHRYGSNLKYYHKVWQQSDTKDNFFKWLDHGDGKDMSLNECSRDQLEKERITYLSAEQRLNYLVKFDSTGKLRWARNDDLVDTTAGLWKDSGNGGGIVPEDMPNRPVQRRGSFESEISSSDDSSVQSDAAMHYLGSPKGKSRWSKVFYKYFTVRGVTNRLLRKTVRRNTWIYTTDKNYNMFVGIKSTGTFQHSSFLGGGLVTSAGLISVKEGLIHTLSPLSGHYRTSIDHFHRFIDVLTERGVDMSHVKVSKAEVALWGIEHIGKFKKKQSHMKDAGKERAVKVGHAVADTLKLGDSSWKREVLEGRKGQETSEGGTQDLIEKGDKEAQARAEEEKTKRDEKEQNVSSPDSAHPHSDGKIDSADAKGAET